MTSAIPSAIVYTPLPTAKYNAAPRLCVSTPTILQESAAVDAGVTSASIRDALGVRGDDSHGIVQLADAVGDCTDDIEDLVVYLAQTFSMVKALEMNSDGSVQAAEFHPESDDETMAMRTCAASASQPW